MVRTVIASQSSSADAVKQFAKLERLSSSPGAVRTLLALNRQIDATPILPTLRVPTLVMHRKTDAQVPVALGRKLAQLISTQNILNILRAITPSGSATLIHFSGTLRNLDRVSARANDRPGARSGDRAFHGHRRLRPEVLLRSVMNAGAGF